MKEKILNAIKHLGFEVEELGEMGYGFEYEGLNYLWMGSKDEEFLSIAIPAIYEKGENEEMEFYQIMDKLNSDLKYVKAYELNNDIWLVYERELFSEENLEELLSHMILRLEYALRFIRDDRKEDACSEDSDDFSGDYLIEDIEVLSDNDENTD